MRDTIVTVVCDSCGEEIDSSNRFVGEIRFRLSLNGVYGYDPLSEGPLDMCEKCMRTLLRGFMERIDSWGKVPTA